MTSITLPRELEAWAEAEIAGGRADSMDALVSCAVELRKRELEGLRAKLDEARASLDRGEGIPWNDFMLELDGWIEADMAAAAE